MIIKDVWVKCDGCGTSDGASFTAKQARCEVKRIGWKRIAGKDYCPHCAPKQKRGQEREK